ncbi:hypothetical protein JRQ81_019626 [Phrynocephalus forsythii]|uniref:Ubiquitin-like domain-containing protein n=1 Tax=Phrynocephalus forsythii TaxID=171643 RepID=A0A9Q0XPR8_9SAUR|nr:hypothetical protein JRQ81_019626 [Phrynocephalus forsythii]
MEQWLKGSHEQNPCFPRARPELATDGHGLKFITVVVKGAAGTQDFQVAENSTVEQLKWEVAPHFKAAKEQVLLIFAGKILKDQDTLLQHDIQDGLTVYLVVKKPELRGQPSLQASASLGPGGRTLSPLDSSSEPPSGTSNMQVLLDSSRRDLLALLALLNEMPERFQACPELMSEVLQSPTVQSMISGDCSPLAVAFILAISTVIGLNALKPSSTVARGQVTQALERASVRDILANTKEMAQFLSESPELRQFALEMPHFSTWMCPSGLSQMVATYKRLLSLASAPVTETDLSQVEDMLEEAHAFRQLFADIGKVFSSSEAQEELEDRLLRQVLATHPGLQQLAEDHAQIGHLLKNPQVVADVVKYIRSPEIRREVDRRCDRMLSNLESMPGGFWVLQHMYQDVEEPLWKGLQGRRTSTLPGPRADTNLSPAGGSRIPPGMENRVPLPDPWAPRPDGSGSKPSKSSSKRGGPEEGGGHGSKEGPLTATLSVGSPGRGQCEASPRPQGSSGPGGPAPGSSHAQLPPSSSSSQGVPPAQVAGRRSEEQQQEVPSRVKPFLTASPAGLTSKNQGGHQEPPNQPRGS